MKVQMANSASRKTREAIREAFAGLLAERGALAKITVTDLVAAAGVTRGTFYTHYENIYQVAVEFEQEITSAMQVEVKALRTKTDVERYFDTVFSHLQAHEEIYRILLISDAPMMFLKQLNASLKDKLVEALPRHSLLEIVFFTDGMISLLVRYFRSEVQASLDDIKKFALRQFWRLVKSSER